MPEKWYKTAAKHSKEVSGKRVGAKKLEKYRKKAREEAGERPGVTDPEAYATAVALRRAQKTGAKPHKKISKEGAEKAARESLSETNPEFISFVESADYKVIQGVYEETGGLIEDRWFGAVASEDSPFDYYRVILYGPDAAKAAAASELKDVLNQEEALANTAIQKLMQKILSEGLKCPKCASDDVLAGTKLLKHHCSACGHDWGEGEAAKKPKKQGKTDEEVTGTGAIGDVASGAAVAPGTVAPRAAVQRKKPDQMQRWLAGASKQRSTGAKKIGLPAYARTGRYGQSEQLDKAIDAALEESYNDNYLRPNQRERRTVNRQADGTSPAGSLGDDIITERPPKNARKKRLRRQA